MLFESQCRSTTAQYVHVRMARSPEPSPEELAAVELARLAKEQGLSLIGLDGQLKQFKQFKQEHGGDGT